MKRLIIIAILVASVVSNTTARIEDGNSDSVSLKAFDGYLVVE